MKSKDKVLNLYPNAKCSATPVNGIWINCRPSKKPMNYQIFNGETKLSHLQCREDWAWAEAVRILKGQNLL